MQNDCTSCEIHKKIATGYAKYVRHNETCMQLCGSVLKYKYKKKLLNSKNLSEETLWTKIHFWIFIVIVLLMYCNLIKQKYKKAEY